MPKMEKSNTKHTIIRNFHANTICEHLAAKLNDFAQAAATALNLDAAMWSAQTQLQNAHATRHCRTHLFNASVPMHKASQHMQTQKHSIINQEKKSPGTITSTARASRDHSYDQAAPPATVTQASQLFSATEAP